MRWAALLPVAYQIFRMGYYGLLVPSTAIAKDASGAKWEQGFVYLANFNRPVPAVGSGDPAGRLALVLLLRGRPSWRQPAGTARARARAGAAPRGGGRVHARQRPVQAVYWIRQGGDFMHGRVLLTPLFCLLAPIAVIPVMLPDRSRTARGAGLPAAPGPPAVLWLAVAGWALWAANSPGMGADATRVTYTGIVDERRFYSQATGHAHPLTAADYLDYPRMRAVLTAINNTPDGALLLPVGQLRLWDVVPAIPPPPDAPADPPGERRSRPHTVFFTNLGMFGMNVGLDVTGDRPDRPGQPTGGAHRAPRGRPHRPRQEPVPGLGGRRGPVAQGAAVHSAVPRRGLDPAGGGGAELPGDRRDAEHDPGSDGTPPVLVEPAATRVEFTRYRIDRVPQYELVRCGLPSAGAAKPPYTGLPATGP